MRCSSQVWLSIFLSASCDAVQAQVNASGKPETIATVEISGPGSLALRRDDTVAKIVVGRSDIVQHGDSNLAEVLKRQPGISVAGGEVRMRGLGAGYTQILINGDPVPQGFSIDSISPEMIERIEILRGATAEQSAQAIAGSINLVLRKAVSRAQREYRAGTAFARGNWSPTMSLQLGDRTGALSYSLSASLTRTALEDRPNTDVAINAANGVLGTLRRFDEWNRTDVSRLSLAPRLNWAVGNGDALTWQNLIELSNVDGHFGAQERTLLGEPTAYPTNSATIGAHTSSLRSDAGWTHNVGQAGKLTIKGGLNVSRRSSAYVFDGIRPDGARGLVRLVDSNADEDAFSFSGKYYAPLAAGHGLGIGWDGGRVWRRERRLQTDRHLSQLASAVLDQAYAANVERFALFVQDEWTIAPQLQSYLGLRWEGVQSATDGKSFEKVRNRSSVFSPSLQILWKPPERSKDQLRLALARSYKAPLTRDLVPRRFTVNNDNSATSPDVEGNPALRPQLSWGLDLAYETYFSASSVASISAFVRRITDVTVQSLYQEGVTWISRPVNQGGAETHGIEFDLKAPLGAWLPGTPPLEIHMSASRNWSRLDAVAGPYNRLADQTPFGANAGLDYRPVGRWNAGFNLMYQGSGITRTNAELSSYKSAQCTLDIYALWRIGARTTLRVSTSNLLGQDRRTAQWYADNHGSIRRGTVSDDATAARFVLEQMF